MLFRSGLSPLHSGFYPKVTSRDTTAAAVVSEAGLSPLDVDDIALVIRAFPIRVAGESGPLANETSWETLSKEGHHQDKLLEFTTVTKKIRRVAHFDPEIVVRAITTNSPTKIFLNHLDYIRSQIKLEDELALDFVRNIESKIGKKIDYIGVSPANVQKTPD